MKHFAGAEIVRFLKAIDFHLKAPYRMEMIGGAVALLCFKVKRETLDIDTTHSVSKIAPACAAAQSDTGLGIEVQTVSIDEAPYH